MSRQDDQQLLHLLLRDSEGVPQQFYTDLQKTPDGRLSFVVGRPDTGEYYRHTIETAFLGEEQMQKLRAKTAARADVDPEKIGFYRLCKHSEKAGDIGDRSRCAECQARVDQEFADFWKPIIYRDGILDLEEIKGNLLDYSTLMDNAKEVYMHVTSGNIGKLNTTSDAIIGEADRQTQKQIDEAIEEVSGILDEADFNAPIRADAPGA